MENLENFTTKEQKGREENPVEPKKSSFYFRKNKNGLILTIHHTITENGKPVKVRLVATCFNEIGEFVAIDKRGCIFVFDLVKKKCWKLIETVHKPYVIRPIPNRPSLYVIGSKNGMLYWLDVGKSAIVHKDYYTKSRIDNISFPGLDLSPYLGVVQSNREAVLFNGDTYQSAYNLEFNQFKVLLKFVAYIPHCEHIFSCFTNDSVQIWSAVSLNAIGTHHPIRRRDRFLELKSPHTLRLNDDRLDDKFPVDCVEIKEFSKGLINSFSFSIDGSVLCLTTLDNYILLVSCATYEFVKIIKVEDATVAGCWLFPKPNQDVLLCRTTKCQLFLVDINKKDLKMLVEEENCCRVELSKDRNLLAAVTSTGDVNIYYVPALIDFLKSAQNCTDMLREAIMQPKGVSVGCFDSEMRKLLTRARLLPILKEYGHYPEKYRNLIWISLLNIPCNRAQFMELIKMEPHPNAVEFDKHLKLRDTKVRRNLVKLLSCLGNWTMVFAYSDFVPVFIFPFVKVFDRNLVTCFEIVATILTNHCQLWFEFHPLEPLNYLGMCENILDHFDPELLAFYRNLDVKPKEYAWALLSNAFSEVLQQNDWYQLWDNVLSCPSYFLVFCAVAYNIVMRAAIMKISNKEDIEEFFHEQNPIDMRKFMKKAYCLLSKCPDDLHPAKYMKEFTKLPKGVYPKFQNFPKKWMEVQENEVHMMRKEHEWIESKIRDLERDEVLMLNHLERGLEREEHAKRLKTMQEKYQDMMKREEERLNFQRKMLILYQKEHRKRKGKVLEYLEGSMNRKKETLHQTELLDLLHDVEKGRKKNQMDLELAEENVKDHEMTLLSHKYGIHNILKVDDYRPLKLQFLDIIESLNREKAQIQQELNTVVKGDVTESKEKVSGKISKIETALREIENEFMNMMNTGGDVV